MQKSKKDIQHTHADISQYKTAPVKAVIIKTDERIS
jgi:hypothetical protein